VERLCVKGRWLLATALIGVGAAGYLFRSEAEALFDQEVTNANAARFSKAAFDDWQAKSPPDRAAFSGLAAYLKQEGVSDVLPLWQLTRTDATPKPWCKRAAFHVPPKSDWPHIVPTLRLIRAEVIPSVGPVEVRSAYRTPDFNTCVGGASQSQHLTFSGIDLVALRATDNRQLFATLCALHRRVGPATHFGFGAYFDPDRPVLNQDARFHIDTAGYRSWGFSKKAGSSGCRLIAVDSKAGLPSSQAKERG
jgi:Peptidase M15